MDISKINTHKKIVCLGGGIGTVNLIKGLKNYNETISVILSMADEGGSGGRLRRLYSIHPPGDIVSCMSALATESDFPASRLLTYRFPGNRYGKDDDLGGHKVGNLMIAALCDITGDFNEAIRLLQKLFNITGDLLPASQEMVSISAKTIEGKIIEGEEKIDLGKYPGKRVLDHVFIHPENPEVSEKVITEIENADIVIAGPGDLYTTILPVLIIPKIAEAVWKSKAKKAFIVNVANKPFETKGYSMQDFIQAISKHLDGFPFDTVIANNNFNIPIPKKYKYDYVVKNTTLLPASVQLVETDLVDPDFPLYHDSKKLAKILLETL